MPKLNKATQKAIAANAIPPVRGVVKNYTPKKRISKKPGRRLGDLRRRAKVAEDVYLRNKWGNGKTKFF